MRLFDQSGKTTPEAGSKPQPMNPIERMLMEFIEKNPALKDNIEAFKTGVLAIAAQGQRIEAHAVAIREQQTELYALMQQIDSRLALSGMQPRVFGEGKGMVSDGTRCPLCNSTSGCDCYSSDQLSGSEPGGEHSSSGSDDSSSRGS